MMAIREEQLKLAGEKYRNVYQLLRASVNKTTDFDSGKCYSADELEPYDALSDRFIRTVEVAIKFFRTYEYYLRAEQSQTLRDGLAPDGKIRRYFFARYLVGYARYPQSYRTRLSSGENSANVLAYSR